MLRYVHLNIQYLYIICLNSLWRVSFKRELMFCFYNVNLKTNSSCLIEAICININLFYISFLKHFSRVGLPSQARRARTRQESSSVFPKSNMNKYIYI